MVIINLCILVHWTKVALALEGLKKESKGVDGQSGKEIKMGTHLRVFSETYPINTNMTGIRCVFFLFLCPYALDQSSLSIGRVKSIFF